MEEQNDIRYKEKLFFAKLITATGVLMCLIVGGCSLFFLSSVNLSNDVVIIIFLMIIPFIISMLILYYGSKKMKFYAEDKAQTLSRKWSYTIMTTGGLITATITIWMVIIVYSELSSAFNHGSGLSASFIDLLLIILCFTTPPLLLGVALILIAKYRLK